MVLIIWDGTTSGILDVIREGKFRSLGHIMRRTTFDAPWSNLNYKVKGTRLRGMPRTTWLKAWITNSWRKDPAWKTWCARTDVSGEHSLSIYRNSYSYLETVGQVSTTSRFVVALKLCLCTGTQMMMISKTFCSTTHGHIGQWRKDPHHSFVIGWVSLAHWHHRSIVIEVAHWRKK